MMAPAKPLPVEVKVPIAAMMSSPRVSRATTIATSMAVDRPEAFGANPLGTKRSGGQPGTGLSCSARNGGKPEFPRDLSRGWFDRGRKSRPAVAGWRTRQRAARRPSVRPAPSRTMLVAPFSRSHRQDARRLYRDDQLDRSCDQALSGQSSCHAPRAPSGTPLPARSMFGIPGRMPD